MLYFTLYIHTDNYLTSYEHLTSYMRTYLIQHLEQSNYEAFSYNVYI